jgi:hypothetical protein
LRYVNDIYFLAAKDQAPQVRCLNLGKTVTESLRASNIDFSSAASLRRQPGTSQKFWQLPAAWRPGVDFSQHTAGERHH